MNGTKQCWRCLRWYSYNDSKSRIHCPACGMVRAKLKTQEPPLKFIFRSIRPMVILKCDYCTAIEAFDLGTCSYMCATCYETKVRYKCDMCGEQKPNDKGRNISPMGFWWCDSCEEEYQMEKL